MLIEQYDENFSGIGGQYIFRGEENILPRIQNLQEVQTPDQIQKICMQVISAVDNMGLVAIDESLSNGEKLKTTQKIPIGHNDDALWKNSAQIRDDWDTKKWQQNPIIGYVWYDSKHTPIGTIYKSVIGKCSRIWISREIATDVGKCSLLVQEMRKKLQNII